MKKIIALIAFGLLSVQQPTHAVLGWLTSKISGKWTQNDIYKLFTTDASKTQYAKVGLLHVAQQIEQYNRHNDKDLASVMLLLRKVASTTDSTASNRLEQIKMAADMLAKTLDLPSMQNLMIYLPAGELPRGFKNPQVKVKDLITAQLKNASGLKTP